jgi:hypothetical protein
MTVPDKSRYGFVSLLRDIVIANPLITRREINQRVQAVLQPLNISQIDSKQIDKFLEILKALKEVTELNRISQHSVWIASQPKWIKLDSCNAVLLGNFYDRRLKFKPIDQFDTVRRFVPDNAAMNIHVNETNISDWLIQSCEGKICKEVEIDKFTELPTKLLCLWNEKKEELLSQNSEPLNYDNIGVIAGKPGEFFGSCKDFNRPTGRWKKLSQVNDGIYFGIKQSENVYETSYVLLVKQYANQIKILTLFDKEQWTWLFLTNAKENGHREICNINSSLIHLTVPLPTTLENWLRIFASKKPDWGQWSSQLEEFSDVKKILEDCGL